MKYPVAIAVLLLFWSVSLNSQNQKNTKKRKSVVTTTLPKTTDLVISRRDYKDKLYGFWLGQCIANWTGLVTEMDKIGDIGRSKRVNFIPDWIGENQISRVFGDKVCRVICLKNIDFVFVGPEGIWGSDDDTDIEYIYQELLYTKQKSILSGEDIKRGMVAAY